MYPANKFNAAKGSCFAVIIKIKKINLKIGPENSEGHKKLADSRGKQYDACYAANAYCQSLFVQSNSVWD